MKNNRKLITLVLCFSLLTTSLITSIRVVYMLSFGLHDSDITMLKGIFSIIVTILEIPTGIIADRYSRKKSLIIGSIFFSLHALFYIALPNFLGFFLTQLFLAISSAFLSGADDSYIEEFAKTELNSSFMQIASKIEYLSSIINASFYLISGILFSIYPKTNFIITFILGCLIVIGLISLPDFQNNQNKAQDENSYLIDIKNVLVDIIKNRKVLLIAIITTLATSSLIFNFELYQIILTNFNIPVEYYGYFYASFMLLNGIGAKISKNITGKIEEKKIFIFSILMVLLSYFLFAKTKLIINIVLGIVIQQLIFGLLNLSIRGLLLNNCHSNNKSTFLSIYSLINNAFKGGLVLILTNILSAYGISFVYTIMMIVVGLFSFILIFI